MRHLEIFKFFLPGQSMVSDISIYICRLGSYDVVLSLYRFDRKLESHTVCSVQKSLSVLRKLIVVLVAIVFR